MTHTNKPNYYGAGSVPIGQATPGETAPRRCALSPDKLISEPFEGIGTTYDVIQYAARTHGTRNAVGQRDVIDIHEEIKEVKKVVDGKETVEKKTWKYFELSEYKYISYVQFKDRIHVLAKALVELGITDRDVWNVYSQTWYVLLSRRSSANWLQHQLAIDCSCLCFHFNNCCYSIRHPRSFRSDSLTE